MFEHPDFTKWEPDNLPRNRQCCLIDEKYIAEYESYMLECFSNDGTDQDPPGYVSFVSVRECEPGNIVLDWRANFMERAHFTDLRLPKKEIVLCVGAEGWDGDPHIFVKSQWLRSIYLRQNSIFAMVDACEMKRALREDRVSMDRLVKLRAMLDCLANEYEDILFLSFADSVILKTNWTVGSFDSPACYSYSPKRILTLIDSIADAFQATLEMDVYAIVTQGSNEFYDDPTYHNEQSNHLALNSLGVPFANLKFIDDSVRKAVKEKGVHSRYQIYLDSCFFYSLNFPKNNQIQPKSRRFSYESRFPGTAEYYCFDRSELKDAE